MTSIHFRTLVVLALCFSFLAACGQKRVATTKPASAPQPQMVNRSEVASERKTPLALEKMPLSGATGSSDEDPFIEQIQEAAARPHVAPPTATASSITQTVPAPGSVQVTNNSASPIGNEMFLGEFELVLPQEGEQIVVDRQQLKAGIVAIISPRDNDSAATYRSRLTMFRDGYGNLPKTYRDQTTYVRQVYRDITGADLTDLPKDGNFSQEQVELILKKEDVDFPDSWKTFSRFRVNPVGEAIDPSGSDDEVISRIAKYEENAVLQVLRTNYDPSMKAEWIEKFRKCLSGNRTEEAGWCHIVTIRKWSSLWEYTSGLTSSASKVEFKPEPGFEDAKALVMFLSRSGKYVGHALPCGLNPIVSFTRIKFSAKGEYQPPAEPEKCNCTVTTTSGGRVENGITVIEPDQSLRFAVGLTGDMSKIKILKEEVLLDGAPKLGGVMDRGQLSLPALVFDHDAFDHVYNVEYRLTYESAGKSLTIVCMLKVRVNKPAPKVLEPKCLTLRSTRTRLGPRDEALVIADVQDLPEDARIEWVTNPASVLTGKFLRTRLVLTGSDYDQLRGSIDRGLRVTFRAFTADGKLLMECEIVLVLSAKPEPVLTTKEGHGFCGKAALKCWLPLAPLAALPFLLGGNDDLVKTDPRGPGTDPGNWRPASLPGRGAFKISIGLGGGSSRR